MVREGQIEARNKSLSKKQKPRNDARKLDKIQLMQEEKQKIVEARELYEKINSLLPLTESNMVVRVNFSFLFLERLLKIHAKTCITIYQH